MNDIAQQAPISIFSSSIFVMLFIIAAGFFWFAALKRKFLIALIPPSILAILNILSPIIAKAVYGELTPESLESGVIICFLSLAAIVALVLIVLARDSKETPDILEKE